MVTGTVAYDVRAPTAFVAASFVVVHLTGFGLAAGLFSISVANTVFLFGFWRGLACAAALIPLIFVDRLWFEPELGIIGALVMLRIRIFRNAKPCTTNNQENKYD